jgi:hypothetical protein
MPYQWVDPEVAVENETRVIYHAYKDGDINDRLTFWFQAGTDSDNEFDIRDTRAWKTTVAIFDEDQRIKATLDKILSSEEYFDLGGEEEVAAIPAPVSTD